MNSQQQELEKVLHECEQAVIKYKAIQMSAGDSYHLYKASIDVGYYIDTQYRTREVRVQVYPKNNSPANIFMFFPDHEANVQAITAGALPINGGTLCCFSQVGTDSTATAKIMMQKKGITIYSNCDFNVAVTTNVISF